MRVKDKHHVLINLQSAFPGFCISSFQLLFQTPTSSPPVYMHVPSISYTPQNTDHASLHVHVMHFTRRLQPWLHQGFYSSVLQIINIFINTAKSVPLEVLHR